MKIEIEFCIQWHYDPEFDRVSKIIKKLKPNVIVNGNQNAPRSGAFEITINDKLVYSKFETDILWKMKCDMMYNYLVLRNY